MMSATSYPAKQHERAQQEFFEVHASIDALLCVRIKEPYVKCSLSSIGSSSL
jgi:hypothetical protein